MPVQARFIHTNIVARDWRTLADFYIDTFGMTPVLPERHLEGTWLDKATGIDNAGIEGIHLRFPGFDNNGPTLEIFQYRENAPGSNKAVNRPGFAHIAFAVDDVGAALEETKAAGGGAVGDVVSVGIEGAGTITFVYATDPEGNVIEFQCWKK